eukprot:TRINITY_DN68643_c0_g1_i1.p1 TRINITY_DN68643_c0_g1~~TRINITY_DN68643_c0_g1_i1.p1  ORF type:complete len:191 (+),score=42.62 TRINITY_DN68643_c0_g1_i1:31-603(+)
MPKCAVYLGSSLGSSVEYRKAAEDLAASLAARKIGLVYGGSKTGLMGLLADAAIELGVEVTGVIPRALLDKELAHPGLHKLIVVDSMHERKTKMFEEADMFVAMPGGVGTLEELLEVLTWSQLDLHKKPIGLLNTRAYYKPLLAMLQHGVNEGFMKQEHLSYIVSGSNPEELLIELGRYNPVRVQKLSKL